VFTQAKIHADGADSLILPTSFAFIRAKLRIATVSLSPCVLVLLLLLGCWALGLLGCCDYKLLGMKIESKI